MQYRGRNHHSGRDTSKSMRVLSLSGESVSLAVLFFTCLAVNSDQLISAPNLTRISQDFSLTLSERDSYVGALIQFGFYVSAGFFSILSGPVIEVIDRSKLLAGLAILSSILACTSGLVPLGRSGYFYFLLIRVCTGVSVGITLPTAFSLLGDLVPVNRRTTMSAFVTTSCAGGAAIGQAIAGLAGSGSSWRAPYFIVACFSFTASVLCFLVLSDPRIETLGEERRSGTSTPETRNKAASAWRSDGRQISRQKPALSMEDLNWSKFHSVLNVATNRLIFAQSMPGCIAWSSIATFLPDFIHKELGFSVKASTGVMAAFAISGLLCSLIGSGIGQSIYNQNRHQLPIFVSTCIVAGAVPLIFLVLFGGGSFFTLLLAVAGGLAATAGPNLKGMLMNANPSTDRGTVFSMFNLIDNFGKGLGPSVLVLITWISGSRRIGFALVFSLWFVSSWIASRLESCLNEDTLAVEIKQEGSNEQREAFDLMHVYHS